MQGARTVALTLSVVFLAACGGSATPPEAPPGSAGNPLPARPNPGAPVAATSEVGSTSQSSAGQDTPPAAPVAEEPRPSSPSPAPPQPKATEQAASTATSAPEPRATATAPPAAPKRSTAARPAGPRLQRALAPSAKRPCSLVAKVEARTIIGVSILEPIEAPQGPTCIYQSRSGAQVVTLAVQKTSFAKLRALVRKRRAITVADRRGLCGRYGRPMLYLPLDGGRVLSVAGPCDVATRFAVRAVARL